MAETTTKTFEHFKGQVRILSVQANGGTVDVQVEHDAGVWVTAEAISADQVGELVFGEATVRIVPAGGATYKVH